MSLIEKLNFIIPNKLLSNIKDYGLDISSALQSPSSSSKSFKIDTSEKKVTIFIHSLTSKESRVLKAVIRADFQEDKNYLIAGIKTKLLDNLYRYKSENTDGQILNFFNDVKIISKFDYYALRDSLYLRSRFVLFEDIRELKRDIRYRYGERGNSISNLCTAGYFENIMIPLYNNDPKEFYAYYDIAIDRGITALFVNAKMKIEEIKKEINRKIKSAKSYGQLKTFHIHGIGKNNIEKIKRCINELKKEKGIQFTEKRIFLHSRVHILVVEINL